MAITINGVDLAMKRENAGVDGMKPGYLAVDPRTVPVAWHRDVARSLAYAQRELELPPLTVIWSQWSGEGESVKGWVMTRLPSRIFLVGFPAAGMVALHEARHAWQFMVGNTAPDDYEERERDALEWGKAAYRATFTVDEIRRTLAEHRAWKEQQR